MRHLSALLGLAALTFSAASLVTSEADAQVAYFGGRVISNVEVVEVSWGGGVDANYLQQLSGFYQAIVVSPWIDWMSEYDTLGKNGLDGQPGSNQHIGRGTFGGIVTINPGNGSSSLQDADILNEIAAQLQAGKLPPPKMDAGGNVNTLYMIDFPPGISINLLGYQSCVQFGAYHSSLTYQGKSVPYGVHPDCGYDFGHATLVHSHELAEAMTDMEVGLALNFTMAGRPQAWVENSQTANETGDLCNLVGGSSVGYTVQKIWSNYAGGCVDNIPLCDGSVSPPSCRNCIALDSGAACGGATPACATAGPMTGRCVTCTAAFQGGCTGATPVCDDGTNSCVGCLANTDCKAPTTPVCDVPTKTCRGCTANTDCATGVCDTTADAEQGSCVACNVDGDCKGSEMQCTAHVCGPKGAPVTSAATTGTGFTTSATGGPFTTGAGGSFGAGGSGNADDGGLTGNGCSCTAAGGSRESAPGLWVAALGVAATFARRKRRA